MRGVLIGLAVLALGACGGGSDGEKADQVAADAREDVAAGKAESGGVPGDFNYLDACTIVAKDAVAKAMGSAVTGTSLSSVRPVGNAPAGFSTCNYALADGRTVTLLTRYSPDGVDVASSFESDKAQMKELGMAYEDMAGLGDAAWYNAPMKSLSVYSGRNKFYVFGLGLADTDPAKAKDQLVALARAEGL